MCNKGINGQVSIDSLERHSINDLVCTRMTSWSILSQHLIGISVDIWVESLLIFADMPVSMDTYQLVDTLPAV